MAATAIEIKIIALSVDLVFAPLFPLVKKSIMPGVDVDDMVAMVVGSCRGFAATKANGQAKIWSTLLPRRLQSR